MGETDVPQSPKKTPAKSLLLFSTLGAAIAFVGVSAFFPRLLLWYFEPPVALGWGNCGGSVEWAIRIYQRVEWGALIVGCLLGALGYLRWRPGKGL